MKIKYIAATVGLTFILSTGAAMSKDNRIAWDIPIPIPTPNIPIQIPGSPPPGLPTIDPKMQVQVDNIKQAMTALEERFADKDPLKASNGTMMDIRQDLIIEGDKIKLHPEYEALKKRAFELRAALARRGGDVGNWEYWQYDGQKVTDNEKKFITAVENEFAELSPTHNARPEERTESLKKLESIFARSDFESNPVLKYYKDNVGDDRLFGSKWFDAMAKVWHVQVNFRFARDSAKEKNIKSAGERAAEAIKFIDEIRAAGIILKDIKVKMDENDPLTEEMDLVKVREACMKLKNSGKAAEDAEKKRQAEIDKKWQTFFKNGRKQLLAEKGEPSGWELCTPERTPESALKSKYWFYWECAAWRQQREVRYYFDANQNLTKTTERTYYYTGCE